MHLGLDKALRVTLQVSPKRLDEFRRHVPPELIEEALLTTQTSSVRDRRLPAQRVVWLVVALSLMRNESILSILDRLGLARPAHDGSTKSLASSAISQARARLGSEPMQLLFVMLAHAWLLEHAASRRWRGLSVWAMDGTKFNVADTPELRAVFGSHHNRHGRSGYPMLRLVALMEARTHLIGAANFGAYTEHERALAAPLWDELPDDALLTMDKGLFALRHVIPLERAGRNQHWLSRARTNLRYRLVRRLARNDLLVEVNVPDAARKDDPTLPATFVARVVRYQRKGFRAEMLLTSLRDPKAYPADDLVALYHERWEIELGYDEIKTQMLEAAITLRSRTKPLVHQEVWGLLLAYNLVRVEAVRIADKLGVPPVRVSFVAVLRLLRLEWDFWGTLRSPVPLNQRIDQLDIDLLRFLLPDRRERTYPRVIKFQSGKYKVGKSRKKRAQRRGRRLK